MRSCRPFCCGSAGLNAFVDDAQLRPADRQLGQAEQPVARERSAVVGPDPGGHAVLVHGGFVDRGNLVQVYAQDGLTKVELAAVRIGNRELIASCAVACAEVALEIHTQKLVQCVTEERGLEYDFVLHFFCFELVSPALLRRLPNVLAAGHFTLGCSISSPACLAIFSDERLRNRVPAPLDARCG